MELSIFPLTLATQFIISHTIINIYLIHSLFYVFRIEIERSSSITLHSANEGSFVELKDPKYPAEKLEVTRTDEPHHENVLKGEGDQETDSTAIKTFFSAFPLALAFPWARWPGFLGLG